MPVYKNEDKNTWYCKFYYKDWQGNRKQKKKEGFKTQREAKAFERDYLHKEEGSCDMSFNSMSELYLEDTKKTLKPTSYSVKKSIFDCRILPVLGDMPINTITPNVLRQFNNTLLDSEEGYSTLYLKKVNGQISCVFNFAVKYYNMRYNPCKLYEGVQGKPKGEMLFWTLDEYKKFIQAVTKKQYFIAYEILFWTGMRSGELLALNIEDVDLDKKQINIDKNYAKLNNEELILTPKTKKSKRVIEIPQFLADEIKDYIGSLYSPSSTDRLITVSRPGLRVKLNACAKKANVKQIRIHDLRHSHASLLIEQGFQPLIIAERLGHENIKTTLETYAHLYPNKQSQVCEKLETLK